MFFFCKRKTDLARHKKSETCKKITLSIENICKDKNIKIEKLSNEIYKLIEQNKELIKKNEEKDTLIKTLQEKSEEYRKIIEKVAMKSTKTVNNKNTYNHNNYLNYISSEPIKFNEIQNRLKQIVTPNSIMFDDNEFHEHIVDNILKDDKGKDKILCTDINRKNFSYKDETSGQLISDPELERLRDKLRKGADIKLVKKELLEKLIEKYEGTHIDPYIRFYDFLKKLDFGNPFVDHLAKKTYIKNKSNNSNQLNETNINDEFIFENF